MLRALTVTIDPKLGDKVREQVQNLNRAVAGDGDDESGSDGIEKTRVGCRAVVCPNRIQSRRGQAGDDVMIDDGLEGHYSDFAAAEQASMALQSVGAFLAKQGALGNATQFNANMKN